MLLPAFLVLALVPGLFWLWFYARKNSYRPEPRRLLAATFALGMVATFPAAVIEFVLLSDSIDVEGLGLGTAAVAMLLVVGPVEELAKFLAVRLLAYRSRYFEEPMDGLVYSAAASLGFASAENFFYIIAYGPEVMVLRGPLSTLGHLVFGSFWGYALGRSPRGSSHVLWAGGGLLMAAVFHGTFNLAVVARVFPAALALIAFGAVWTTSRFDWARRVSPFRYRRNYPLRECSACRRPVRVASRFCSWCGAALFRGPEAIVCGHCRTRNRPDAGFCTQCGDAFVLR